MDDLTVEIAALRAEAGKAFTAATDAVASEAAENLYLGRKGRLRDLYGRLGKLPPEAKGPAGQALNALKAELEAQAAAAKARAGGKRPAAPDGFDRTLPGDEPIVGRRHVVWRTIDEMKEVFVRMGFSIVYGPEIETEQNNFEALNIPLEHPSRDGFDTFYLDRVHLLRSHTSPVQIRAMQRMKPPLRTVAPGRVFRPDTPDASHSPMFHQMEGLMVGPDVSFADLKGVLSVFTRLMFGPETKTRFRPSFFPFTEPSAEVDVSCILCGAKGCGACKQSGWMEIMGAGMVHPQVFRTVGYDPEAVTGFAFGMGVERVAMLRHRIPDIKLLTENHWEFLRQF